MSSPQEMHDVPVESIVRLAQALVRIRSRAHEDPTEGILECLQGWLRDRGVASSLLHDGDERAVGLCVEISAGNAGPSLCLNACLDTAPFGAEKQWIHPPDSAMIAGGRLYGRGTADSKIAVALFSHLAVELKDGLRNGQLFMLFDADEHTGEFGGVKAFMNTGRRPDAFVVGYPGNYGIVVGARGFLRARLTTHGVAAHTGSKSGKGTNAIVKMSKLVTALHEHELPTETDPFFAFGPKVTVTAVSGGNGFSQVPDECQCSVDIRLTPSVGKEPMSDWLLSVTRKIDQLFAGTEKTSVDFKDTWPAYRLPESSRLVDVFTRNAREVFARDLPLVVCGPSNIGNYLAVQTIPAICGFGVTYGNTHAANEYVEIASIAPVYVTYFGAVRDFLNG